MIQHPALMNLPPCTIVPDRKKKGSCHSAAVWLLISKISLHICIFAFGVCWTFRFDQRKQKPILLKVSTSLFFDTLLQGAASFGSGIASHPSFGEVQGAGEPAPKRQEEQWANRSVVMLPLRIFLLAYMKFCTSWIRRYPKDTSSQCAFDFYADQNDRKPVLHDSHTWLSYAKISKHILWYSCTKASRACSPVHYWESQECISATVVLF